MEKPPNCLFQKLLQSFLEFLSLRWLLFFGRLEKDAEADAYQHDNEDENWKIHNLS